MILDVEVIKHHFIKELDIVNRKSSQRAAHKKTCSRGVPLPRDLIMRISAFVIF